LLKTNEIEEAIEVEKKALLFQDRRNYHGQRASCREIRKLARSVFMIVAVVLY